MMNPVRPSTRASRAALALAVFLNPMLGWSQRTVETPVISVSGPAGITVTPSAPGVQLGANLSPTSRVLTSVNLQAAPTVNRLSLPAVSIAAERRGLAPGVKGPPSKSRMLAPAATHRGEGRLSLSALADGAETVVRAMAIDGTSGGYRATGHFFEGARVERHDMAGTGSIDPSAPNSGGGAGVGGGRSGDALPTKMTMIRMTNPLFPGTHTRFIPGNRSTVDLIAGAAAGENGRYLLVATPHKDGSGLFPVASVVRVVDFSADGNQVSAMFEVVSEAVIDRVEQGTDGRTVATVHYQGRVASDPKETRGTLKAVKEAVKELMVLDADLNHRLLQAVLTVDDPENVATVLGSEMPFSTETKQSILAARSPLDRLRIIYRSLSELKAEGQIAQRTKSELGKQQKEYILRQKMKAIQAELGQEDEGGGEIEGLAAKVEASRMPEEVKAKARKELKKLKTTNPESSEFTVGRNYVDWLVSLPWDTRTTDNLDLAKAEEILNRDHSGLGDVKERILEFLAVRKMTGNKKGAIIVFDGPPGVGKTAIGKAIADAMGRNYIRWSVGGVRDEAEVRGHRRTYVGAMPGTPIQKVKEAGSVNTVFVVDEGDKIGQKNQTGGDPSAALLELFDPEQNSNFRDHYLDVPFDFSETLFIVTSNELMNLPEPLRHRMELIQFSAYTDNEKLAIARDHLIEKKRKANGLTKEQADLAPATILRIVRGWTHEAGVRDLEREIDAVLRKVVSGMVRQGKPAPGIIGPDQLEAYLGRPKYKERPSAANGIGTGTGLSVSGYGGGTLTMEATATPGNGRFTLRKQMLEMTDDSAHNVETYIKSIAHKYGITPKWFREHNVDFNFFPANKVDGPSAGILMATTLLSEATGRKIKDGIAMTGEISSKGKVGGIGGIKEKVLAAHRKGYHTVIFPEANLADADDIPADVRAEIKLIPVSDAQEVFALALEETSSRPAAPVEGRWQAFVSAVMRLIGR